MNAEGTVADVLAGAARFAVVCGDAAEVLRTIGDGVAAAVVTDPPSGIAFMGAEWDRDKGGRAQWVAWLAGILAEARRCTHDGGRSVVWSLPRTSHWTGCAVEDAGWSIENTVTHLYGCLTPDTEILVNGEWVSYDKATAGSLALCYDSERDSLAWKPIGELVVYEHHQHLYRLRGEVTDQLVTRGHRCPVYRDGRVVFLSADEVAEGGAALVPVVEDVRGMLATLPLPQRAGGALEGVQRGVPHGAAAVSPEEAAAHLRDLRGEVHPEEQPRSGQGEALLDKVQRAAPREGGGVRREDDGHRVEREGGLDGGVAGVVRGEDDRPAQPCVEGRRDARVVEGELCARGVRAVPAGVPSDGAARRVDSGAPSARGAGDRSDAHDGGERAPRQPQPAGQPPREPDALRVELGSQEVRASRFARADLVRVTREHHDGVVWCVTVPTGAFVARRNGKVFITGNTGWPKGSSQLKPAAETWWLARTGRSTDLNVEACRVGTAKSVPASPPKGDRLANYGERPGRRGQTGDEDGHNPNVGRYPPNVVLSHAPGCARVGTRKVQSNSANASRGAGGYGGRLAAQIGNTGYADTDGTETVEAWECVPEGCPVAELDAQTGTLTTNPGVGVRRSIGYGGASRETAYDYDASEGGPSRFFPCFPADPAVFRYVAKPSSAEKGAGAETNAHPTVKSIALMRWLIDLVTQRDDLVVDPFGGSGTTACAALASGRRVILVERDPHFAEIARQRCAHWGAEWDAPARASKRKAPRVADAGPQGDLFAARTEPTK